MIMALRTPLMRRPMTGAGEAAAEPGREDGRLLRRSVDVDDCVGGDFRVGHLYPVFEGSVEILLRGLIHDDRLGKRGRLRLRRRRWRFNESFRKRAVNRYRERGGRLRARRSGEGTQTTRARHVGIEYKFGGVQMTSFIEG